MMKSVKDGSGGATGISGCDLDQGERLGSGGAPWIRGSDWDQGERLGSGGATWIRGAAGIKGSDSEKDQQAGGAVKRATSRGEMARFFESVS
jgi:hypothetical protein